MTSSINAKKGGSRNVAIFLATFNGQKFLDQQLISFTRQTYQAWDLYVSDDGSTDDTLTLLQQIKWNDHAIHIRKGPQKGFAANFLSLICDPSIKSDFYACSDQDDIWLDNKLERAIEKLSVFPSDKPALYCSSTEYIDNNNRSFGFSYKFKRKPGFRNALVQNIAGGNTMVFNHAAKLILEKAGMVDVLFHDWWLYQAISACDGVVMYDEKPTVLYRQHQENIIGSNMSWKARFNRIKMLFRGDYREWNDRNIRALSALKNNMSPSALKTIEKFSRGRACSSAFARIFNMAQSRVYRQTLCGSAALIVATICNKN